jgi:hypothetical protein
MKKAFSLVIFICFGRGAWGQNNPDGYYIGLEPNCYTLENGKTQCYPDADHKKWKLYHLTELKIQGDSVFADQSPISIYKKDTSFSASDGAFYYYHGHMKQNDSVVNIQLNLIFCDYCGMPDPANLKAFPGFPRVKNWVCKKTTGGLLINGYLFRKTNQKEAMTSEHPEPYLNH